MFFIMNFVEPIIMSPNTLGKELQNLIKARLIERVQGSVTERYGYIICVVKFMEIGSGKILDTSGDVLFNVKYKAVVLKPFINEILDGVVEKIEPYGIHVNAGVLKIFISSSNFPGDFQYNENTKSYKSEIQNDEVKAESEVRFRITGINYEFNEFLSTAVMNESYLGPIK